MDILSFEERRKNVNQGHPELYHSIKFCCRCSLFQYLHFTMVNSNASFTRTNIQFYSSNCLVKGWLYSPSVSATAPKSAAVIMATGFSSVKECNYGFTAEHLAEAGLTVLLLDYPNFGESGGDVRQEVDPQLQVQSCRDAISYTAALSTVDDNRIGIWGGSFGGGHALVVSALDTRIKCAVYLTPFVGKKIPGNNALPKAILTLKALFNSDRLDRLRSRVSKMVPVVSDNQGDFVAMPSTFAMNYVRSFEAVAPNWKNSVTLRSMELSMEYQPRLFANKTGNIPKLFIIATHDEVMEEQGIMDVYNEMSAPKELAYIDGNHFSPYMEKFDEVSELASQWFLKNL